MSIRLPSRYEDLDEAFRARLRPNSALIDAAKSAFKSMRVSGGIRFLPVYGESGSGKTCAARELGTHLPSARTFLLSPNEIESANDLRKLLEQHIDLFNSIELRIAVIDQYEETVADRSNIPTQFIERLSLLDRSDLRSHPMLFIWLTTSREFQEQLAKATSRNARILVDRSFTLEGPGRDDWPAIIEETFSFHNNNRPLADFEILQPDLEHLSKQTLSGTLGEAIERTGTKLFQHTEIQDLSEYEVAILWPVTDGLRITRVSQFTNPRDGYKLDWNSWYRELNTEDRNQLPLTALNRARLYFNVRLIPIAAADLMHLCRSLKDESCQLHDSYLSQFKRTHFYSIITEQWDPENYSPLRERESKRAESARDWWETVTNEPTNIGRRIAKCLVACGHDAKYEQEIKTPHGSVRADVLLQRPSSRQNKMIIELKAFSAENTRPSSIKDAIRTTLRRHAQLAGFLDRQ